MAPAIAPSTALTTYSPYGTAIRGDNGPFQPGQPGNYGRNAQYNYMQAQNKALQQMDTQGSDAASRANGLAQLSTATIRYNPETAMTKQDLIMNAYGYAEQDVLSLGGQNGRMDRTLLTNALGSGAAEKFLKAEDLNNDGAVDTKEHTAYILFSDNAPELISGTLNAFAQTPNSIPGQDPAVLQQWAQEFSQIPSKQDGQITAPERMAAEKAVDLAPTFTKTTLQEMEKTLNISGTIDQANGGAANPFQASV